MEPGDLEDGRPSTADEQRLADGSPLARGLLTLGGEGELALGLLRDAHAILCDPGRYSRPYVISVSSCRTALECLMELAGSDFKALLAARNAVTKALKPLFEENGTRKSAQPLERLLRTLDALGEFPAVVTSTGDLGQALTALHRSRRHYKAEPPDPARHITAMKSVMDALDGLQEVPGRLNGQNPLAVALRNLHSVRREPGVRLDALLEQHLEVLGAAYADLREMENKPGSKHVQQVTELVRRQTGRQPGAAEMKAFKAWSDFYTSASKIIHTGADSGAAGALGFWRGVVEVISELVTTLSEQAPRLVALASVTDPTEEQIREVERLHHPSAAPYLFGRFTGWMWLEKLDPVRLLPEGDRWPAAPYFQRLAAEDPSRVAAWIRPHLDAVLRTGSGAAGQLVWLCRHLGEHAGPLIAKVVAWDTAGDLTVPTLYWALAVDATLRDAQWVSTITRVLGANAETSRITPWEIRDGIGQLRSAAYTANGETSLAEPVRAGLVQVLRSHLAVDGVRAGLRLTDDLRVAGLAGEPALVGARLAAAACLELARTDRSWGVALSGRTQAWAKPGIGGWEADRLLAVHLLEVDGKDRDEGLWWAAACGVLARLSTGLLTPDVGAFVQAVVSARGERAPDVAAALREGLGPVPDGEAISAARASLEEWESRAEEWMAAFEAGTDLPEWQPAVPEGWRSAWVLSGVLPPDVVEPWIEVVELLTEHLGAPPPVGEPMTETVPVRAEAASQKDTFLALCAREGALAAAGVLGRQTPTSGTYFERTEFAHLKAAVGTDPGGWTADVNGVVAALVNFDLRTVYLEAVATHWRAAGLADDPARHRAVVGAAWNLVIALRADAGSRDPGVDEQARAVTCRLLKACWAQRIDTGVPEEAVVRWLVGQAGAWTGPTRSAGDPYTAAAATAGGLAMVALVQWAVCRAAVDGQLPEEAATVMEAALSEGTDDRALAVIGAALTPLRQHAQAWVSGHAGQLLDIAAANSPIRSWLRHVVRMDTGEFALLGDVDRTALVAYLRTDAPQQVFDRFAVTLLRSPATLGQDFVAELAGGEGGFDALTELLGQIARALPAENGAEDLHGRGFELWGQAIDVAAGTAGSHLRGAGHFAFAEGLESERWLSHTLRTVEVSADLEWVDSVAARAARNPESVPARRILSLLLPLLDTPGGRDDYRLRVVVQHAQELFRQLAPGDEGRVELGTALGRYADDVDAAASV